MIHQVRELHVRREARAAYGVDEGLFTLSGNAILPNLQAVRRAGRRDDRRRARSRKRGGAGGAGRRSTRWASSTRSSTPSSRSTASSEDPEAIDDALDHLDETLGARRGRRRARALHDRLPPARGAPRRARRPRRTSPARPRARPTARSRSRSWPPAGSRTPTRRSPRIASCSTTTTSPAATAYRAVVEELGRFFGDPSAVRARAPGPRHDAARPGARRARRRWPGSCAGSARTGALSSPPTSATGSGPSWIGS